MNVVSGNLAMGAIRLLSPEFLEIRMHSDPEITASALQLVKALLSSKAKDNVVHLAVSHD
jgi:hypothetical protein